MVKVTATAKIPLDAATYWLGRNTPEFVEHENRVLKNESKIIRNILDSKGRIDKQIIITKPDLSVVPPFVMRLGPEGGLSFTDNITIVRDDTETPYCLTCNTVPSVFQDKCKINSVVKVYPSLDGSKTCKQTITIDISVNVWGVGSSIESLVSKLILEGYKKLPKVTSSYVEHTDPAKIPSPVKVAEMETCHGAVDGMEITMDDEDEYYYDASDSIDSVGGYSDSGVGSANTSDDVSLHRMNFFTTQPDVTLLSDTEVRYGGRKTFSSFHRSTSGFLESDSNKVITTYNLEDEGVEPEGWKFNLCGLNLCCR
eukprot:CFRG0646T1